MLKDLKSKKSITIHDVARYVGVSYTTVSRVLNNKGEITEQTRQRVNQAIAELGYSPNPFARSLVTNRTKVLGFIVSEFTNFFLAEIAQGILRHAHPFGYATSIFMTDFDPALEIEALDSLAQRRSDGIIIATPEDDVIAQHILRLANKGMHFAIIGWRVPHENIISIMTPINAGAYKATNHLISLGHKRIAHIKASPRVGQGHGQEKLIGYRKALEDARIVFDPQLVVVSDYSVEGGLNACHHLLQLDNPPTAIFTTDDQVALGALSAINAANLQVPDDISVVGFDDIGLAKYSRPPLTTVSQQASKLGEIAVDELLKCIKSETHEAEINLDCELIVRASTSSPKG